MQTIPVVSVVIPTFNYGHFVIEAVDSALAQTYSPVEVIVVDDGSTDDTHGRLNVYGDRIRYIHQNNAGLSAARNKGIQAASGTYVAFLDSDDAFHPRKLEIQMDVIASNPSLALVGTNSFSYEPRVWSDLPNSLPTRAITLRDVVLAPRFSPSSVVARRECFKRVGMFDTNLRSAEDRDMWIRIAAQYPMARVDLPLTWYRQTPGSMSRNAERMEHFERVVLEKAFRLPELNGNWTLRRKARGIADLASCLLYREANCPYKALKRLLSSFLWWPMYRKKDTKYKFSRLRVLLATLRSQLIR